VKKEILHNPFFWHGMLLICRKSVRTKSRLYGRLIREGVAMTTEKERVRVVRHCREACADEKRIQKGGAA